MNILQKCRISVSDNTEYTWRGVYMLWGRCSANQELMEAYAEQHWSLQQEHTQENLPNTMRPITMSMAGQGCSSSSSSQKIQQHLKSVLGKSGCATRMFIVYIM